MVEPNPPAQAAPPQAPAVGPSFATIGPVHPPSKQLHHLHFCIDSRPKWRELPSSSFSFDLSLTHSPASGSLLSLVL
ncbi:hypothetical protein AAC387_Pa02g3440 [Persea americana]